MIAPPPDIEESIQWAAKAAKVPVAIVRSVAYHESRYNPNAVSPAGAKGLMQLMPVNIEKYVVSDPFDVDQSARAGAEILKTLYNRHGDWGSALAAYNWGTGNVRRNPDSKDWPKNTRRYVASVLKDARMSNLSVASIIPRSSIFAPIMISVAGIVLGGLLLDFFRRRRVGR